LRWDEEWWEDEDAEWWECTLPLLSLAYPCPWSEPGVEGGDATVGPPVGPKKREPLLAVGEGVGSP
jgi:hypothetical protein